MGFRLGSEKIFWLLIVMLVTPIGCSDSGTSSGEEPGDNSNDPPANTSKPTSLPDFSSISLYDSDSPLNTKIPANFTVDQNSDTYIQKLVEGSGDNESLIVQVGQYSATVFFADENTPRVDVQLPCGDSWEMGVSKLTDVPIPDFAEPSNDVDGEDAPIEEGICAEESSQDNHMIIIDTVNGCEYDFWQTRKESGNWVASWGNAIPLSDDGIYDHGLSTRGSGFAFLGGLIWPDELENGEITHALVFSYPFTRSGGPVSPATDSDGITDDNSGLPEGALLRLDPDLDLSGLGLNSSEITIATALQEYGMYLVDTGGDAGVALYAIDPASVDGNPYDGLLAEGDYPTLDNIPLEHLEVISLGDQDSDFESNLDLIENSCTTFE